MAVNAKLSDLTAAAALTGGELIYLVKDNNSRKLALGAVGAKLLDDTGQTTAQTTLGGGAKGRAIFQDTGNTAVLTELGFSALAQNLRDDTGQTQMLTTLGSGAKGRAIFRDTGSTAVLTELGFSALARSLIDDTGQTKMQATLGVDGIIQNVVSDFGAVGDGVTDNASAFTTAKAAEGMIFIPKPATSYNFATGVTSVNSVSAWLPDPSATWAELFDGGLFSLWRGRATSSVIPGSNIWRLSDRVFVGYAASHYAGDDHNLPDGGTSWLNDTGDGPAYLPANAALLVMNGIGDTGNTVGHNQPYGIVSAIDSLGTNFSPIAIGAAVNNVNVNSNAWAYIAEIYMGSGTASTYVLEYDVKNGGANATCTPVTAITGGPVGAYGIWAVGGGPAAFGSQPANPSTAAMVVLGNLQTWNTGIVFAEDALTAGEAISMSSEGDGGAHRIRWYNTLGNNVFQVLSTATDTVAWNLIRADAGLQVTAGSATLAQFAAGTTGTTYNFLNITNAASGGGIGPLVSAAGIDTNASLRLRPKGTENVRVQSGDATDKILVNNTGIGFFGTAAVAKPTGVAVTAAGIHAALVTLGLIAA